MLLLIRAVYVEQFFSIGLVYGPSEFSVAKRWSIPQGGIEGSNTLRRPFLFFTLDKYVEHMSSWHRKKTPIVLVTWWAWEMKANQDTDRELMFLESSGF